MYLTKGTKVAITDKNLLSNDKARVWNKYKCEIIGYLILATEEVSWEDGLIRNFSHLCLADTEHAPAQGKKFDMIGNPKSNETQSKFEKIFIRYVNTLV